MIMRLDCTGSVELSRSLLLTPVWSSQTAWRVFSWLLLSAMRCECLEQVNGHMFRLQRGQLAASQLEICRNTALSRKSVQTALRLLEAEGIVIRDTAPDGRITVYTVGTLPGGREEKAAAPGDGVKAGVPAEPSPGQCHGQSFDTDNARCGNRMNSEDPCSGDSPGARNGAGVKTGAATPNDTLKRLEPRKTDSQPKKHVRWRWTCDICGADSVGMVPPGVVPPSSPCLKSIWGRCDGMAHPEREG